MLIDCHAHLDLFKDIDSVIKRSVESGISRIISNGGNPEANRKVIELASKYDIVKPALGIDPQFTDINIKEEIAFIEKNNMIAIGEVGLDNTYANKGKQVILFEEMIKLAEKLSLPIIVHSRKAEQEVIDLLDSSSIKHRILHCFGGKLKLAKQAAEKGYIFSIPTSILKNEHFQHLAREVNINQILTETDAPFQSPFPNIKNEPKNIIEAVKKISEIKSFTIEETKNNIWMNYQRIFE